MKPSIYSIFLPQQGCSNPCLFCNQKAVTGIETTPGLNEIKKQIVFFLNSNSYSPNSEIAFYGGNFTGLDWSIQRELLEMVKTAVKETRRQATVRISTRPDYLNERLLTRLKEDNVATIELGVQSLSDEVLSASGRGYAAETAIAACRKVVEKGFQLGVHLMLGLPKDTKATSLKTLDEIINIQPHFIRIHPTLVLKNTELARHYYAGEYQPLSLVEAINWCKEMVIRCEKAKVPVARFGLQPSPELCKPGTVVAGPFHPAFGELVKSALAYDRMNIQLSELLEKQRETSEVTFYVPARELSIYRGQHNQNLIQLKKAWNVNSISIVGIPTN